MIFFPDYPGRLEGDWHPRKLDPEDVWITAADGTRLHAWWVPNTNAKFTFLAFHGNASNIANRAPTYEFLRDTPANVLALEYRGYGHSEGKPTEAGLYLDAEAAYQYLVNTRRLDPKSIVSFGQSVGTTIAVDLAAHHRVGGVILEAPFPSASRVASKLFWFLPGLNLLSVVTESLPAIPQLKRYRRTSCSHARRGRDFRERRRNCLPVEKGSFPTCAGDGRSRRRVCALQRYRSEEGGA